MVQTVIGDETHLKSLEDRLSPLSPQVGLIIGKLSSISDRGNVYALIPTPATDSGGPACYLRSEGGREEKKKGGGSKGGKSSNETQSAVVIDADWVTEHARQVSKMLLGGMNVIGFYVWAPEASFKATSTAIFSQVIRGVSQAAPWFDSQFDERLLIHISYAPRKWVCRICDLASGNLRPCDFKFSKVLNSLQEFRCIYNFEIRLPISKGSKSEYSTLKNVSTKGINFLSKKLQTAKALLDGKLVTEDLSFNTESPHNVELLLPLEIDLTTEESSVDEIAGIVLFSGSVFASSYLGPRDSVSQAIFDLKGDIITSLRSRLDLILEESEGEIISNNENEKSEKSINQLTFHELSKNYRLSFPKRVLVRWTAGVYICDYLQPSETFEDTKERCKEMISIEETIETNSILDIESAVGPTVTKSFWEVVNGEINNNHSNKGEIYTGNNLTGSNNSYLKFLPAFLALLLAVLVGLGIVLLR